MIIERSGICELSYAELLEAYVQNAVTHHTLDDAGGVCDACGKPIEHWHMSACSIIAGKQKMNDEDDNVRIRDLLSWSADLGEFLPVGMMVSASDGKPRCTECKRPVYKSIRNAGQNYCSWCRKYAPA